MLSGISFDWGGIIERIKLLRTDGEGNDKNGINDNKQVHILF